MAATGFTPIQLYFSTTASAAPSAGNLANGELALNITDGKLFYKDNGGVVRVLATAAGSAGDVVGPGSSTDNALVRFDGTTGKLVQSSVGVLSDAGVLTGLTGLTSSGNVTLSALTSGRVTYAGTGGLLQDSANLTFDGTTLTANALTVSNAVTLSGGTANGVTYLNGSKVLTTGSALTFDGTKLGIGGAASQLIHAQTSGTTAYLQVQATSGSAYYGVDSAGVYIGSTANIPSIFNVNGSEQMRLTSTGLGIGTSSPGYKLDVQGAAGVGLQIFETSTTTNKRLRVTQESAYVKYEATYSSGGNAHSWWNGGTRQMDLDVSGNLGLGVTPSAWVDDKAVQLPQGSISSGYEYGISTNANAYRSASNVWKYTNGQAAFRANINNGGFQWFTAPSGTAGNAISFTQAMTLDASGKLGIGTSSPRAKLEIFSSLDSTFNSNAIIGGSATTKIAFDPFGGLSSGVGGLADGSLAFYGNGANTERARIDSSGNLLVGTTTTPVGNRVNGHYFYANGGYNSRTIASNRDWGISVNSGSVVNFYSDNGSAAVLAGSINVNGIVTTYTSISDYRTKEIIGVVTGSGERIDALEPIEYISKTDGLRARGFLAHKFQEVYSNSVTGEKDAMDDDGKPVYQSMQASTPEVIADLVAEIQSLRKRLAAAGIA